jgi:hypothetical protein
MAPGYHEIRPADMVDADRICRMLGVDANDSHAHRWIASCVAPLIHAVIMPADGTRDQAWMDAARQHEYAHSWGYVHPSGGKGWLDPSGTPVPDADPANTNVADANVANAVQIAKAAGGSVSPSTHDPVLAVLRFLHHLYHR